jgi:hypothetical protein
LDHFSNKDLNKVFGQELESVKRLLDQELKDKEESSSDQNQDNEMKWIKIQMSRSRNDLDAILSPRVSRRGFLEKTEIW